MLDWMKIAKAKSGSASLAQFSEKIGRKNTETGPGVGNSGILLSSSIETLIDFMGWYPRKKLQVVRKKLLGFKSTQIMLGELEDSKHLKSSYGFKLKQIIEGTGESRRKKLQEESPLSVAEQVDCLIEHARDPELLSRAWIGWSAHI